MLLGTNSWTRTPVSRLYAAALDGRTSADVYQWEHVIDDAEAERILTGTQASPSAGALLGFHRVAEELMQVVVVMHCHTDSQASAAITFADCRG